MKTLLEGYKEGYKNSFVLDVTAVPLSRNDFNYFMLSTLWTIILKVIMIFGKQSHGQVATSLVIKVDTLRAVNNGDICAIDLHIFVVRPQLMWLI